MPLGRAVGEKWNAAHSMKHSVQAMPLARFLSEGDEHGSWSSRRTQQMANDCNLGIASSSWNCLSIYRDQKTYGNRKHDRVVCGRWVGAVVPLPDRSSGYCGSSTAPCTEMDMLWGNRADLFRGNGDLDFSYRAARQSNVGQPGNGVGPTRAHIARRAARVADAPTSSFRQNGLTLNPHRSVNARRRSRRLPGNGLPVPGPEPQFA